MSSKRAFPPLPRLLVASLAAVVLLQGGSLALAFDADGFPQTALAQWLVAGGYAGFLILVAAAPGEVEALFPKQSPIDLRRGAHYGAIVAVSGALLVVVGLAGTVETVHLLERPAAAPASFDPGTEADVLTGLVFNLVLLVGAPLIWLGALYPRRSALAMLGLRAPATARAIGIGLASAFVGIVLVAALLVAVTEVAGFEIPENERALAIGRALTPIAALAVAVASGVSEEVFFRGFLQPRIGVLGQSLVFAVAHLNYVNVGEIVAVFALAIVFGLLYRRTKNLWAPIAAHFAFNLVMLLAAGLAA